MRQILCALAFITSLTAHADPPTPPEHKERDYKAIGGGLYVKADDDLSADDDGNTSILVFSREELSAGGNYTFRLTLSDAVRWNLLHGTYVAGALGELYGQLITIDCAHRTYAVTDARMADPTVIWRTASTLPALAPLFRYVCSHQAPRQTNTDPYVAPPPNPAEIAPPQTAAQSVRPEEPVRDLANEVIQWEARVESCVTNSDLARRQRQGDFYFFPAAKLVGLLVIPPSVKIKHHADAALQLYQFCTRSRTWPRDAPVPTPLPDPIQQVIDRCMRQPSYTWALCTNNNPPRN